MRNRFLLGAGVALAMSLSWADAQAQFLAAPSGPGAWYFGGEGGWTSLDRQTGALGGFAVGAVAFGPSRVSQTFNDGYNVGARAGYLWGPWRFEEEFRFQQSGISRTTVGLPASAFICGAVACTARGGNRDAYAIMTNAIYDFNIGWALTPHIGAGVGAVILHDGANAFASSTDVEFGYQGLAGVRYNINPSLAFDVDYRYLGTTGASFRSNIGGLRYTSGYETHNVVASLSLLFGAPPPPVAVPPLPPAPPPVARQVFLVFFDWDKDTITPEGMQIVQQAAAAFRAGGPVTIQVTGYTDRSGSPGYNQRLSERRANNVANAMARMGVPRQQMAVSGRGENDNRVPTAPGVREPQNRRVEIVFP
jgi:outer membrane protein OmpA-like peptidoglycan-associated protein